MRILSVFAVCFVMLCGQALASDERFTVEIKVDVTDENASLAREKAMSNANRAAVTAVARRISTQNGAAKIAGMTDAQLINFVKETSVVSERNSDVRYMADLRIVINEDLLKEYMKEREIPMLSSNSTKILIVPLFREFSDDAPMLWESNNLWKQAWDNASISSAIKFISIPTSAGNTAALNAAEAAATASQALERAMRLNGATDVYVLDASYDGVEGLNIMATSLSGTRREIKVAGAKSSGSELFVKAVDEVSRQLEQEILTQKTNQSAKESEVTILYPFGSLGQWINAEQKIKALEEVTDMQVQAMAQGKAQFKIRYTGEFPNLLRQLRTKGYSLENGGNYMILKNIGD